MKEFYWQQCQLLKSYSQLIRLKKRKNDSFKTLFNSLIIIIIIIIIIREIYSLII